MYQKFCQPMRIKIVLVLFITFWISQAKAQSEVEWSNLMDITFKDIYLESEDIYVYYPLFSEKQKVLDSTEVTITGYIIPLDIEANMYFLSAYPFSACFFCGSAGPESVMAVNFSGNNRRYDTDERISLKGILKLNDSDVEELIYILNEAVEIPK